MKNRFVMKASVAAVTLAFSMGAFAAATLTTDGTVAGGGGGVYAAESNMPATGLVLYQGAAADLSATGELGVARAVDAKAYVRVDLSSGVFDQVPSATLVDTGPTTISGSLLAGGQASNYAVFEFTPASTENFAANAAFAFDGKRLKVTDKNTINLTYRQFGTDTLAVSATGALHTRTAPEYVKFANAITVDSSVKENSQAKVKAKNGAYFAFDESSTTPEIEEAISKTSITHTARAKPDDGVNSIIGDILSNTAGHTIAINGDFGAADAVYLKTADCAAGDPLPAVGNAYRGVISGTTATFSGLSNANLSPGGDLYVCFKAKGNMAIPASTYSGTVTFASATGYTASTAVTGAGEITRDGIVLTFNHIAARGGQRTFVQVVNKGTMNAPYKTQCYSQGTAPVNGAEGTVNSNRTMQINAGTLCPATANAESAQMIFEASNGVTGAVVRVNTTSGDTGLANAQ